MTKKTRYTVELRRSDTGEESEHLIIAFDEAMAKGLAIERARGVLPVMADRKYATFEVLSCEIALPRR